MGKLLIFSSPYQMINIFSAAVIIIILLYPPFAGLNGSIHHFECVHLSAYGEECRSCGLTRSFAAMTHGDFSSAVTLNRSGPLVFLFFAVQLLMRLFFGIKVHLLSDAGGSVNGADSKSAGRIGNWITLGAVKKTGGNKVTRLALADGILSAILFIFCFRYLILFWH